MQNTPDELSSDAHTVTRDHYIAVTHHFDIHEYHKDATVTIPITAELIQKLITQHYTST